MNNRIFEITNEEGLSRLDPAKFNPEDYTDEAIDHLWGVCNALWIRPNEPKEPHVEISSGLCSDGYVNMRRVLRYTNLCMIFAKLLVFVLWKRFPGYSYNHRISWVIGSDHTAATLSFCVALLLGAKHEFTEKGPNKTQLWRRGIIRQDEVVLQVEDLIATSDTVRAVRLGLRQGNRCPINFFPAVLTLAHRSKNQLIDNIYPILSLRHYDMKTWPRDQCPLHDQGSVAIHEPQFHWGRLTGNYS